MAVTFNIQFRISVATKVIRLTDTSTGFTYGKGCFKVEFPNGVVRNLPDFSNADISTAGNFIDVPCEVDASGNVVTGTYIISYAVINNLSAGQTPLVRTFDFNWIEPTNGITNFSDVITPEVVFKDLTSYSPIGSFTGALTRTITGSFPSTSEVSGSSPVTSTSTNTVTVVSGANYYEGVYTPTSAVSVAYTHTSNAWLTILYTRTFSKTFDIRKCPNQLELVQKINAYRVIIDAYKETNDTQFNLLSEQYDLVIALYSHLIAMHQTTTQDGSEPILRELLSILEPYSGTYTYQSTKMLTFSLAVSGANSFSISDGTNTDVVPLGTTVTFASGNAALVPIITNNNVTYSPTFGTLINTFAQGNDSRFHNPVTIGTANGLSISTQALSLAAATTGSAGAMSSSDKTKLDGIASGATANVGTVTSVALTAPAAFTVTGSPITTAGTLAIAAAGNSAQYITGAGALATLNTANVPENTNLYFTTSRARTSISLTTTGTTGAATYDNTTGVLNIPSYIGGVTSFNTRTGAIVLSSADVTTALTYTPVPTNRNLTINGVSFDLSTDRSWTIASGVTSFNTRTGAITPTAGDYTTALVTEVTNLYYTDARARAAISLTTTGTSGSATYNNTTGVLNIPAYQGGVTSFNTRTGAITLTSSDVTTALTYTPYNATNPSAYIALTSLSFVAGSGAYNNTTGVITIPTNNTHLTNGAGYITGITSGNVTTALGFTPENVANKGIANGYASLDGGGLVPSTQLPSYVDDVLEFANLAALPATGETGKIYVTLDTNKIYRWSGATYIEVSPTVGTIWGGITGTLANQTDLQNALNAKQASLTGTGFVVSTAGTITYDTSTYYLASNPNSYIALTALSSSATGLTYTNTTGVFSLTAGYAIPTTASATNWDTAYNNRITSLTVTGSSGSSTLVSNVLNIPTYTLSGLGGITATFLSGTSGISYNSTTGVISTSLTQYTDALARASVSLTTTGTSGASTYNSTTGVFNIPNYGSALSGYLPLTGGTLTGALGGTSASFSSSVTGTIFQSVGGTGVNLGFSIQPSGWNGAKHRFGVPTSGNTSILSFNWNGTERDTVLYSSSVITLTNGAVVIGTGTANPVTALTIDSSGGATFASSVTATAFIPSGATIPTNGMYLSAANTLNFATASTERMRITSGGNVLIGTTTDAGFRLDVNGTARVSGALTGSSTAVFSGNITADGGTPVVLTGTGTVNIWNSRVILRQNGAALNRAELYSDNGIQLTTSSGFGVVIPNGTVGIGITSPNTSSLLDITSTTKGFLPPRMTTTQRDAIATPATGLQVYDTTVNTLSFYNGSAWSLVNNPSARNEQNFTATAGQTTFTVASGYVVGLVDVFVNGVRYLPSDYTATNGTTVVLGIGLLAGDAVTILNYTSVVTALPTSRNVQDFTATAAQTTFTVTNGYIVGLIDVFVNGSKLTSSEFTATNGTTFVLTVASTVGDQVQSINYTASVNGISGAGTINELAYFTASGTIASLPVATYPSLTELSYVKGVTSAIQTQLNAKAATLSGTTNYVAKFTSSTAIGNSLIFDNGTNVGIGTTSPVSLFNLYGDTPLLQLQNSTTGTTSGDGTRITLSGSDLQIINRETANIILYTTDTERMRITSAGNVGIGTTSPLNALDVRQANATMGNYQTIQAFSTNSAGINLGGGISLGGFYTGTSDIAQFASIVGRKENATSGNYDGYLAFGTNAQATGVVERMRITSAGNVEIGAYVYARKGASGVAFTTSNAVNADWEVETTSAGKTYMGTSGNTLAINRNGGDFLWRKSGSTVSGIGLWMQSANADIYSSIANGTNTYHVYDTTNSAYRFYVTGGGIINASNTTISAISDIRLKENIVDLEVGLDAIMALRPRKFDWKKESGNSGKNIRGFVAQEFEEVFPDLIDESINPSPEGEEPYKQIRQDLIPTLVKAIQEQQVQIEELKTLLKAQ